MAKYVLQIQMIIIKVKQFRAALKYFCLFYIIISVFNSFIKVIASIKTALTTFLVSRIICLKSAEYFIFPTGFIETIDHLPTDNRPIEPTTTYHFPTDPLTANPPTH